MPETIKAAKERERDEAREWVRGILEDRKGPVFTLTEYGRGQTDWVRLFVPLEQEGEIDVFEITGRAAKAAGYRFVNDNRRYGIAIGGGQFNKALDVVDALYRSVYGRAVDQLTEWRKL